MSETATVIPTGCVPAGRRLGVKAVPKGGRRPTPAARPVPRGKASLLESRRRLDAFLVRLGRMSEQERRRASRLEFDRWQRSVWAARYPEEVPLVDGEYEWIAFGLADLD